MRRGDDGGGDVDVADNDPERALLRLLAVEAYRDGGRARVTDFRDRYDSGDRIPSLLKEIGRTTTATPGAGPAAAAAGGPRRPPPTKLLAFLEDHPDFFAVSDRAERGKPHVVRLLPRGEEIARQRLDKDGGGGSIDEEEEERERIRQRAAELEERVAHVLRHRLGKIERRRRKAERELAAAAPNEVGNGPAGSRSEPASSNGADDPTAAATLNAPKGDDSDHQPPPPPPPVSLKWLAKQCPNELHLYARRLLSRPVGELPMTDGWYSAVLPVFAEFLESRPSGIFRVSTDRGGNRKNDDNRGAVGADDYEVYGVELVESPPLNGAGVTHDATNGEAPPAIDAAAVAARVLDVVRSTANRVGGMSLGRLLEDPPLRQLLGGRDLLRLAEDDPSLLGGPAGVEIFADAERRGHLYVRMAEGVGGSGDASDPSSFGVGEEASGRSGRGQGRNRLLADDVGTYSCTDSRSAIAMANALANAVLDKLHGGGAQGRRDRDGGGPADAGENGRRSKRVLPDDALCVDLTAGVGGNALALAKAFPELRAYEIDARRAEYLRRNLIDKFGDDILASFDDNRRSDRGRVEVECRDAVGALPELRERRRRTGSSGCPVAVMVDPPWGGIHYKRTQSDDATVGGGEEDDEEEERLGLGEDMPLSRVVALAAVHLAPAVLGMKVPLSFDVESFVRRVERRSELREGEGAGEYSFRILCKRKIGRQLFSMLDIGICLRPSY